MSLISHIVNRRFSKGDDIRDAGLTTPEDVLRYDDILYAEDQKWNLLDVYRPKDKEGKLPVIISVHGGGWVYADKERYQYYCMDLATRGFAIVNFTYRLAPKHKFPSQLEDICSLFQWVFDNADEYGFDTDSLFAVGDSAGAHLLALYCDLCISRNYASDFSFQIPYILPKAIALNCGVYDVHVSKGFLYMLIKDLLKSTKDIDLIDPLKHMTSAFPQTFIMTSVKDMMKEDSSLLLKRMEELEIPNIYKCYDNERHDLGHVFHLNIKDRDAIICNDEQCAYFSSFMHM